MIGLFLVKGNSMAFVQMDAIDEEILTSNNKLLQLGCTPPNAQVHKNVLLSITRSVMANYSSCLQKCCRKVLLLLMPKYAAHMDTK